MLQVARLSSSAGLAESLGRSFRALVGRNHGPAARSARSARGVREVPSWERDEEPIEAPEPDPRAELVVRIQERNPSADDLFLAGFDDEQLRSYLAHLESASQPRGREAVWARSSALAGVSAYECDLVR